VVVVSALRKPAPRPAVLSFAPKRRTPLPSARSTRAEFSQRENCHLSPAARSTRAEFSQRENCYRK